MNSNLKRILVELVKELEAKPKPVSSRPENLVDYFKINPDLTEDVANIVAEYNRNLISHGLDAGRAGDISKALSGMIWGTILEDLRWKDVNQQ